ncbi:hypothetical protein [Pseudomonas mandelii]|uniref:hypothetical protein n=1 Tax=Pseudomonas mandelii TaxID=75612 RepID=UPI00224B7D25|nr:hypothetical protein [Pseudomonas mandelii]MCX2898895.1 hypothetical protein [Pseudomonas mandelii]
MNAIASGPALSNLCKHLSNGDIHTLPLARLGSQSQRFATMPLPRIYADALHSNHRSADKRELTGFTSMGLMPAKTLRCGDVSLCESKPGSAGTHQQTAKLVQTLRSLACEAARLRKIPSNNFCLKISVRHWLLPTATNKNYAQYF